MNDHRLFPAATRTGQVTELYRLSELDEPAPVEESAAQVLLRYIPDGITQHGGLRIIEAHTGPNPIAMSLVNARVRLYIFQQTVRRWTFSAGLALAVCATWAGLDHDTLLAVVLWAMTIACFPLFVMASPDAPEGQ